jgi:hypothetical protein
VPVAVVIVEKATGQQIALRREWRA